MHGKPTAASRQDIYFVWAPGIRKDYVGQIIVALRNRKLKHKEELSECRARGLDGCHRCFKQLRFGYFLFVGIAHLDQVDEDLSRTAMRHYEWVWFHLSQPTLNSQDQHGSFAAEKITP